ncbi:DUF6009 family protein [Streptomyces sp. NPDC050738]|uniref:DUF6009 family protein n=1 Tax=Streptomyces sp. NPDC050738 TaxID=3154744 RepID=UPI0034164885
MTKDREAICHEDGIIWTEDISTFDYVRQTLVVDASTRRRPVSWRGQGRRVGYSVLKPGSPSGDSPGGFVRRVFWVKDYDRSEQPRGTYKTTTPSEGVDPRTVAPGVWGDLTDRAWGGRLPVTPDSETDSQPESAMGAKHEATQQAVKEAFADWLYLHNVSVPDTMGAAVSEAFTRWLNTHSEQLVAAIAEAVANKASLPDPPAAQDET